MDIIKRLQEAADVIERGAALRMDTTVFIKDDGLTLEITRSSNAKKLYINGAYDLYRERKEAADD